MVVHGTCESRLGRGVRAPRCESEDMVCRNLAATIYLETWRAMELREKDVLHMGILNRGDSAFLSGRLLSRHALPAVELVRKGCE
jgi:hypothetical protein